MALSNGLPASAQSITLTAILTGAGEATQVANGVNTGAFGTATVVVTFTVPATASNDFGYSGTVKFSDFVLRPDQGIRSPDDMVQAILGGNSYVNVHSAVNTGGEIRGQLTIKP